MLTYKAGQGQAVSYDYHYNVRGKGATCRKQDFFARAALRPSRRYTMPSQTVRTSVAAVRRTSELRRLRCRACKAEANLPGCPLTQSVRGAFYWREQSSLPHSARLLTHPLPRLVRMRFRVRGSVVAQRCNTVPHQRRAPCRGCVRTSSFPRSYLSIHNGSRGRAQW